MLKVLNRRTLNFAFPEVHKDAVLEIEFIRTLRVPDDGRLNALPPGFEAFELDHVEKYPEKVPADWRKHQGLLLPMYQGEALWIYFDAPENYPFAVKIGAGKICAVTGEAWRPGLIQGEMADADGTVIPLQNYLPVPEQPWLDGFNVGKNEVRQFVAAPLGEGVTVEEQLTGEANFGGIQIEVIPVKPEYFDQDSIDDEDLCFSSIPTGCMPRGFGLGAGGKIEQTIEKDERSLEEYDFKHTSRVFVHLVNSEDWQNLTGRAMPRPPFTAEDYNKAGLPWFEWYSDGKSVVGSNKLAQVKSIGELDNKVAEKDKLVSNPEQVITVKPKEVKDGVW